MKWFGRDWTADSSLRVVGSAQSETENFADVSLSSQHVKAMGMSQSLLTHMMLRLL